MYSCPVESEDSFSPEVFPITAEAGQQEQQEQHLGPKPVRVCSGLLTHRTADSLFLVASGMCTGRVLAEKEARPLRERLLGRGVAAGRGDFCKRGGLALVTSRG